MDLFMKNKSENLKYLVFIQLFKRTILEILMEEENVYIRELDLNDIGPKDQHDVKSGIKWIVIGKPGTGKSTLLEAIMYSKKHVCPTIKVHSGTEDSNSFFGSKVPDIFITNGLDVEDLSSIENLKKRQKIAKQFLEPIDVNPWAMFIIDDCSSDNRIFKKPIFQELYKNGRHWRQIHILSLQYSLDIPPQIRACVDGVFILREQNPSMRKKLYENYGGGVDTFDQWCDLMDALTEDYHAMFINNRTTSNKLEDYIFYFKANMDNIPKDFKFGCKEIWEFNRERYDQRFTGV